jgi:hypothetical protein
MRLVQLFDGGPPSPARQPLPKRSPSQSFWQCILPVVLSHPLHALFPAYLAQHSRQPFYPPPFRSVILSVHLLSSPLLSRTLISLARPSTLRGWDPALRAKPSLPVPALPPDRNQFESDISPASARPAITRRYYFWGVCSPIFYYVAPCCRALPDGNLTSHRIAPSPSGPLYRFSSFQIYFPSPSCYLYL